MSHLEYLMHLKHVVQSWQMIGIGKEVLPLQFLCSFPLCSRRIQITQRWEKGTQMYIWCFS